MKGERFKTLETKLPRLEKLRREEQEKLHSFQLLKQNLGWQSGRNQASPREMT
jgi:hypothetical protein